MWILNRWFLRKRCLYWRSWFLFKTWIEWLIWFDLYFRLLFWFIIVKRKITLFYRCHVCLRVIPHHQIIRHWRRLMHSQCWQYFVFEVNIWFLMFHIFVFQKEILKWKWTFICFGQTVTHIITYIIFDFCRF